MNRKVSIWKHVRLADGQWRYCRPVLDEKKCGSKPADALAAAERQRALFKAMEHGIVQRPTRWPYCVLCNQYLSASYGELLRL